MWGICQIRAIGCNMHPVWGPPNIGMILDIPILGGPQIGTPFWTQYGVKANTGTLVLFQVCQ